MDEKRLQQWLCGCGPEWGVQLQTSLSRSMYSSLHHSTRCSLWARHFAFHVHVTLVFAADSAGCDGITHNRHSKPTRQLNVSPCEAKAVGWRACSLPEPIGSSRPSPGRLPSAAPPPSPID
jgi:hypothetical protein